MKQKNIEASSTLAEGKVEEKEPGIARIEKEKNAEKEEVNDETTVQSEPLYHRNELLEHAQQVFKVKPEVVLGALHGNDKQELSVTEVKEAIKEFLSREVK